MGYYTEYDISAFGYQFPNDMDAEQVVIDFLGGDNPFEDRCKWYDHDVHMKKISKLYPDALFKLSGNGEESPDLWVKYYQGGKVHPVRAKITYEPFDASKLSEDARLPDR